MNALIVRLAICGLFASVTVANAHVSETYQYDDAGRLSRIEYGDGTSISYTYDLAGNRLSVKQISVPNDPPAISAIADQILNEDDSLSGIVFTVSDAGPNASDVGELVVTATSGDTSLIPNAGLVLTGTSADRSLAITPAADANGSTVVTLVVTDSLGGTAENQFAARVVAVADPLQLDETPDQTSNEDAVLGPLTLTLTDPDNEVITVTASSSDQSLVANGQIQIAGAGTSRSLTITPEPNANGAVTISLSATAGSREVSDEFELTITAVNDLPTISAIPDQNFDPESAPSPIQFSVGDEETAAEDIVVGAASSNQTLLANGNIQLGGSGAIRTIFAQLTEGEIGSTVLTLSVTDTDGGVTTESFTIEVSDSSVSAYANGGIGAISLWALLFLIGAGYARQRFGKLNLRPLQ